LSHKVKNVFLQGNVMYFPDHKTWTVRCIKTVAGKFRKKYCIHIWWWIHKYLLNKVAVQCEVYVACYSYHTHYCNLGIFWTVQILMHNQRP